MTEFMRHKLGLSELVSPWRVLRFRYVIWPAGRLLVCLPAGHRDTGMTTLMALARGTHRRCRFCGNLVPKRMPATGDT